MISDNQDIGLYIFSGNLVAGNYIGTDANGDAPATGSQPVGIQVGNGVGGPHNTIGGTTTAARNVISGNSGEGVLINAGATMTLVEGNYIGTNAAGTAAVPNGDGVEIAGSNNDTIGGTAAGAGNVISGNHAVGVSLSGASQITIQGNIIGLGADGLTILGQGGDGIALDGASGDNSIGGTIAGAGNTISANGNNGIDLLAGAGDTANTIVGNIVGLDAAGNAADNEFGMAIGGTGNTVGGTTAAARNVFGGNLGSSVTGAEIFLSGSLNLIEGNYIGTNKDATAAETNAGFFITGSNNTIGGVVSGSGNVIGGALVSAGIYILNSSMNLIEGNFIGTNAGGTIALPNGDGVVIDGSNNTIGGVAAGAGNTIAFNQSSATGKGVVVVAGTGNFVQSNSIYGNEHDGIQLYGGSSGLVSDNTIGGTIAGAGNIVFGNGGYGIDLLAGTGDTDNLIAGNIVGLNGSGNAAANTLGGMTIGGTGNTVGGTAAAARNVISGNSVLGSDVNGMFMSGSMNLIEGNYIGTTTGGTGAVPNGTGVEITGSNNTIGGTAAGAGAPSPSIRARVWWWTPEPAMPCCRT